MKVAAKDREEAAVLCSIGASNIDSIMAAGHARGSSSAARTLAYHALYEAMKHDWSHRYAEAEAMLRTGWTP